ncbi:patatin-like phospholipase family protein [Vibrio hippocampi]|uniref:PNPLA domain-containing protein n=1 Tax=Vibrio hippocampi TaxID=654686 RepID=A0ABM8ZLX3_9VIBR|nr:patatin family protein [Vibrio hippocampi]CAH0529534.1 hypothetical protein VHP8226_03288 [Vibrio hippocampi]
MKQNSALVIEGGAMRGIFAAGVLDAFLSQDYQPFDFAIGVSAGASNLLGYLAKAPERSYQVITQLATTKSFFSPARFLAGGNLTDVKWLSDASMQQFPICLETLFNTIPFYAVTTNIETGLADYVKVRGENIHQVIEATTALPIAYKNNPCFGGACYTDGALADSIPVVEAYRRGARDITVVLSHPLSYSMPEPKREWLIKAMLAKNPKVAEAMLFRNKCYNAALQFIRYPPADAKVRVIAPPEDFPVKRLTRNKSVLDQGYQMGLNAGQSHLANRSGQHQMTLEDCPFC